jgi:hypothetical protein
MQVAGWLLVVGRHTLFEFGSTLAACSCSLCAHPLCHVPAAAGDCGPSLACLCVPPPLACVTVCQSVQLSVCPYGVLSGLLQMHPCIVVWQLLLSCQRGVCGRSTWKE